MKKLLSLLFAALAQCPAIAADQVNLIGHYTNMIHSADDDPHILSGYFLSLYAKKNHYYGSLSVATGAEEALGARLQNIVFNATTKRLSFQAEYATGWEADGNTHQKGVEAHPVLTFRGIVTSDSVIGQITINDATCIVCEPTVRKVVLKRNSDTYIKEERPLPSR